MFKLLTLTVLNSKMSSISTFKQILNHSNKSLLYYK